MFAVSRKETLLAEVKGVFAELSGENLAEADPQASFFDLGLDSLFLTQAAQALRKKFNVKISFRQLLDDLSALGALADYIDSQLPADQFAPQIAPASEASLPQQSGGRRQRSARPAYAATRGNRQAGRRACAHGTPARLRSRPPPCRVAPLRSRNASALTSRSTARRPAGFTPRQQAHLDALIARYTARTPQSKAFTQKHRARFADPRAVSGFRPFWKEMVYPIVAERSEGARIWDLDGNEYIDVTMGFGTNLFGHSPKFVMDAVRDAARQRHRSRPELEAGRRGVPIFSASSPGTSASPFAAPAPRRRWARSASRAP